MVISILKAEYLDNYRIRLFFDDGKINDLDLGPFLKRSQNPMTNQYLDITKFRNFHIEFGDLVWGDLEMCFPIWDMYTGRI